MLTLLPSQKLVECLLVFVWVVSSVTLGPAKVPLDKDQEPDVFEQAGKPEQRDG